MGFLTNEPIIRTFNDGLNDAVGAIPAHRVTMFTGQTPEDLDATGTDWREPNTANDAPTAYWHFFPIEQPLTFRFSGSVKATSAAGAGAFIRLIMPPSLPARVGISRVGAGPGIDNFQFVWRGQVTNITVALADNTYYRVGMEVDLGAGVARGYLNTTAGQTTNAGDAGLEVRASYAIESGTVPYANETVYPGLDLSAAAAAAGDYSGIENPFLEEWRLPFSAQFPGGSSFSVPENDPYTLYKSELALFHALTQARLR